MMKHIRNSALLATSLLSLSLPSFAGDPAMQIRLTINQQHTATATLADNSAARDFVTRLPLTLEMEDYHATEKIHVLPKKLDTTTVPDGMDPAPGELAYYAPWGNLAFFYKDFRYSRGLIPLATIDADDAKTIFNRPGTLSVRIERKP